MHIVQSPTAARHCRCPARNPALGARERPAAIWTACHRVALLHFARFCMATVHGVQWRVQWHMLPPIVEAAVQACCVVRVVVR